MSPILVRGNATDAELAAVLAVVTAAPGDPKPPTGYARWRAERVRALRRERR
jgi:hypothetical protein